MRSGDDCGSVLYQCHAAAVNEHACLPCKQRKVSRHTGHEALRATPARYKPPDTVSRSGRRLSRRTIDLVSLQIAKGSVKQRRGEIRARRVPNHISDSVIALSRSTTLHVDQHRWSV